MDIVSALAILSPFPVEIQEKYYTFAGSYHPIIIPTATLSPEQHHSFLSNGHSSNIEAAFLIALRIHDYQLAWDLYERIPPEHIPSINMNNQTQLWIAHELALKKIPNDLNGVVIRSSQPTHRKKLKNCQRIRSSLFQSYSSLPKILWTGPILLEDADSNAIIPRPLLPTIQLDNASWTDDEICRHMSRLILQRYKPPAQGWPQWLLAGLAEVTLAQFRGQGPSPRKMLRIRSNAGAQAIRALWKDPTATDSDKQQLAQALCAPLIHSRTRQHLASFLDLIRNDLDPASAYRIAYGLSLEDLLTQR